MLTLFHVHLLFHSRIYTQTHPAPLKCVRPPGQEMQLNKVCEIIHRRDKSFPLAGGFWVRCWVLLKRLVLSVSLCQRDAGGRTGLNVFLGLSQSTEKVRWMKCVREICKIS